MSSFTYKIIDYDEINRYFTVVVTTDDPSISKKESIISVHHDFNVNEEAVHQLILNNINSNLYRNWYYEKNPVATPEEINAFIGKTHTEEYNYDNSNGFLSEVPQPEPKIQKPIDVEFDISKDKLAARWAFDNAVSIEDL